MSISADLSIVKDRIDKVRLSGVILASTLTIELLDKDKRLVSRRILKPNSFVIGFMKMLYSALRATQYENIKVARVRQTVRYQVEYRETQYTREQAGIQVWAVKEDDKRGIIIGTGTKTFSPYDTWLDAQIPNGIGSGKVLYLSCDVDVTRVTGNIASLEISRTFINSSGSDIDVHEIGLAGYVVGTGAYVLLMRDLIPTESFPDGYSLSVKYTFMVMV